MSEQELQQRQGDDDDEFIRVRRMDLLTELDRYPEDLGPDEYEAMDRLWDAYWAAPFPQDYDAWRKEIWFLRRSRSFWNREEDIAKAIGLSTNQYVDIENGITPPSPELRLKIEQCLRTGEVDA